MSRFELAIIHALRRIFDWLDVLARLGFEWAYAWGDVLDRGWRRLTRCRSRGLALALFALSTACGFHDIHGAFDIVGLAVGIGVVLFAGWVMWRPRPVTNAGAPRETAMVGWLVQGMSGIVWWSLVVLARNIGRVVNAPTTTNVLAVVNLASFLLAVGLFLVAVRGPRGGRGLRVWLRDRFGRRELVPVRVPR